MKPPTTHPNIVLFMLDQLSAKWLEAARAGACETPNLDRLAARSVTFTNAYTSNPVCCPARATLATGLTSRQHGVTDNGYELDPELPTFMRLLQQSGWRTGCFGKLHLHPHFAGLHPDYTPYGFDVTHITEDPRGGEWLDWIQAEHPEHVDAALATIWAAAIPELADYGPDHQNLRDRIREVRRNFDWTSPAVPDADWKHSALPLPKSLSQTEWITRHALDFIRNTAPEQPLLAQVSYVQPHSPFQAPEECFARINDRRIPAPVVAEWQSDARHPASWDAMARETRAANWQSSRRCYFADIVHLDEQLGRICDALETTGRWENTVLILLADHGEMLHDHGLIGKGNMHYDACIRVPLMISGLGLRQNAVCDEFVQLEDIFPTILALAGLPTPTLPNIGPYLQDDPGYLPGRSLLPLCRDKDAKSHRDHAYSESYGSITSASIQGWARTVRSRRYRYTWYPEGGGEQLFDLQNDPDETVNLAANPVCADIRLQLREKLMNDIVLQDYPPSKRNLYSIGVH